MSIPVDLGELPAEIARFGPVAILVTNSAAGPPHVASVAVTVAGEHLAVPAGRRTRANVAVRPDVTLVWISGAEPEHCLIVDGTARDGSDDSLLVRATSAVLHRLARTSETG